MYDYQDYDTDIDLAKLRAARYGQLKKEQVPEAMIMGGRYIPAHGLEYLIGSLRNARGEAGEIEQQNKIIELEGAKRKATADALRRFAEMAQGTPENVAGDGMGPVRPAQEGNMSEAYAQLMQSGNPQLMQAGMQGLGQQQQYRMAREDKETAREYAQQQAQAALAARAEENAINRQFRQDLASQQIQANMDIRRMGIEAQRQAQAAAQANRTVTVLGPNGEPITVPQSQSQGLPLYNPEQAKRLQQQTTKQEARQQLSEVIGKLGQDYEALHERGGIASAKSGALENVGAWLGTNPVGQYLGGVVGTENQSTRQSIEQTRPLLLSLIKNATGMSASQMNSNAELKLYLDAATNPKLTLEANREALKNLDKLFGLGLYKLPAPAPAPAPTVKNPILPPGVTPQNLKQTKPVTPEELEALVRKHTKQ